MNENENTMAGAYDEWNEINEADAKERKRQAEKERQEKENEEARASKWGAMATQIKDMLISECFVGVLDRISENEAHHYDGYGWDIRAKVGKAYVSVSIRKEYPTSGYSYKRVHRDREPIGLQVVTEYDNGRGYGQGNQTRSIYRVKPDGKWNSKGLIKKINEKLSNYQAMIDREQAQKDETERKVEDKERMRQLMEKSLGCPVEGLSVTRTDYSKSYGSGRNTWHPTKEDVAVRRFKAAMGTEKDSLSVTFQLDEKVDQTTFLSVNGNLTMDQLEQVVALVKGFEAK